MGLRWCGLAALAALLLSCATAPEHDAGAADSGLGAGAEDAGADAGSRAPYADVVAVNVSGAGPFTFAVAIESSDTGCAQYADWWEVLSEDGALLYRRTLGHSHTDDNGTTDPGAPGNTFTRSGGPVDAAASDTVIVRAHLHPAGYVGRAMRGSVEDGFEAFTPAADFATELADAPPQPPACAF
ncbi:MAG: hypothetical protein AB8I08_18945 [Sandaracinaceae bacterium]